MAFNAVLSALYDVARDTFDYRHVDYLPKHKKLATSLMDIITQAVLEEGNVTSSTGGGSDNVSSLGQEPHKSADKRPGGGRVEMTKKIKLQDPELIDVSGDSLSDDEYDASSSGHEAKFDTNSGIGEDITESNQAESTGETDPGRLPSMSPEDLAFEMSNANHEEKERSKRMATKRAVFDELVPEVVRVTGSEADTTQRLILEINARTRQVAVEAEPKLASVLKPFQIDGIKFLYDCVIESVEQVNEKRSPGSGCILAHSMGMGKKLQTIAFLYTVHTNQMIKKWFKRSLIVVPKSCTRSWEAEFGLWLFKNDLNQLACDNLDEAKTMIKREAVLEFWRRGKGVLIISHLTFVSMVKQISSTSSKYPPSYIKTIRECLINPGPDIVVVDEGHCLKNSKTELNVSLSMIKTLRRVILTGSPLQGNLYEYHTMVNFVKPHFLGTTAEFKNQFARPISDGESKQSSDGQIKIMKERRSLLDQLLDSFVQRFDYTVLPKYLPPKHEYVLFVQLTDLQIKVYERYLSDTKMIDWSTIHVDATVFRAICAHPNLMYIFGERARRQMVENGVEDVDLTECHDTPSQAGESVSEKVAQDGSIPAPDEEPRSNQNEPKTKNVDIRLSCKFILLFQMLHYCEMHKEKLVVFSQQLEVLDLIEYFLRTIDREQGNNLAVMTDGLRNTWKVKQDYFRIDYKTSTEEKMVWSDTYNDPNNVQARLCLLLTRAGLVGMNLIGANRCIIFDVSWNPLDDIRAMFRIFRFGQTKECFIYRFVSWGTMEHKVFERQVVKESLAAPFIHKHSIENHYDDKNLYEFDPKPINPPIPPFPKDDLLKELERLDYTSDCTVTFHEHDSLLVDQTSDSFGDKEKLVVWAAYWQQQSE